MMQVADAENEKRQETLGLFQDVVNMDHDALEEWLDTDDSRKVGSKAGGRTESVGHRSGRRIVRLMEKDRDEYTDADYRHMRKVAGYVHRHLAQRPEGDVEDTAWRYSLMNWGHDPLKD